LEKNRFEQILVTGKIAPDEDDLGPWLRERGVEFQVLPQMGRAINPLKDISSLFAIIGMLLKHKPHILATETSKAGFLGRTALIFYRPLAFLRGLPIPKAIHTFHGHTFSGYFSPAKARLFLGLERFLARFATWRIVVISPLQLQEICHKFKVGKKKQFFLLPLGIDLDQFSGAKKNRENFRKELGIEEDQKLICAVGRVAKVKNYGLFLKAVAEFAQINPELYKNCRFALIGGGLTADMDQLKTKARELGINDRFIFCGNRSDPEAFIPGMDILMLTSLNEGTPLAIIEAGALAKPVLATMVGGIGDLLGDASEPEIFPKLHKLQRGLGAKNQNARALAKGLEWLLLNQDQAIELGQSLKKYIEQHHAKEVMINFLEDLYRKASAN
jgi:glycosyltransferase involved in cell wall biosynthesis